VWLPAIATPSADEALRLSGFVQFLGLALHLPADAAEDAAALSALKAQMEARQNERRGGGETPGRPV
jgi:hypothetical protein